MLFLINVCLSLNTNLLETYVMEKSSELNLSKTQMNQDLEIEKGVLKKKKKPTAVN